MLEAYVVTYEMVVVVPPVAGFVEKHVGDQKIETRLEVRRVPIYKITEMS